MAESITKQQTRQRPRPGPVPTLYSVPGCPIHLLTIALGKNTSRYYLSEIGGADGGRGFFVEKYWCEQKEGEPTSYHVLIAADPREDVCHCLGQLRWSDRHPCKHITSLRKLIAEGKLPAPVRCGTCHGVGGPPSLFGHDDCCPECGR